MGNLLKEFHKKRLLPKSLKCSDGWNQENLRKVETFLEYLELQYRLQEIRQIRQKHYDAYMDHLNDSRSPETMRKYALAIRRFVETSKLPIRINPESAKKRKLNTRFERIRKVLIAHGIQGDLLETMSRDLLKL